MLADSLTSIVTLMYFEKISPDIDRLDVLGIITEICKSANFDANFSVLGEYIS